MHGRQSCLVACVRTEPSVGKGLWTHRTQPGVGHGHRTHRTQSPGWSSQDATLPYLTQATFLLMHLEHDRTCDLIQRKNANLGQRIREWGFQRRTAYRFNGRTSGYFRTDKGTPQGSPLSAILFHISIKATVTIATGKDTIILS